MFRLLNHFNKKGDVLIPITVVLIALFGCLMVYSASYYTAEIQTGNKYFYLNKQLIGLLLGTISMLFFCFFDYKKIMKASLIILIISIILLVLVFTPLGVENYGAKRWIKVGGITIQPSEIAKFSYVIFCATYFYKSKKDNSKFSKILPALLVGAIICLLIMLEPNMSITVCVGALMLAILLAVGVKIKHLMLIIAPLLLLAPLLIVLEPYRLKRLLAFINPWASPKGEGYQLLQSLYGLGSGGWFGVGLFNSRQKYRFLPFAESDFILSIIGEELGFVGCAILFATFLFLGYRAYKVASKSKNAFAYLLVVGITTIFLIQVAVNALVVTGSIPPTGLPLPFISSGNTSLIVFMSAFGIVYNVSTDREKI